MTTATSSTTTTLAVDEQSLAVRAALDLLELRNDVLQAPDATRVRDYIAASCACLAREEGIVTGFVNEGRRWTGPAVEPLGVRVAHSSDRTASMIVVARQEETTIIGPSGTTSVPLVELAPYAVGLIWTRDGWRIRDLRGITMERHEAEAIVAGGLDG